jgi:hypothetical protein
LSNLKKHIHLGTSAAGGKIPGGGGDGEFCEEGGDDAVEPFGEGGDDVVEFSKSNKNTSYGFLVEKRCFADDVRENFAESSAGEEDDGEAYASGIIPQEDYNDGTLWRQLIASTKSREKKRKKSLGKRKGIAGISEGVSRWTKTLMVSGRTKRYTFLLRVPKKFKFATSEECEALAKELAPDETMDAADDLKALLCNEINSTSRAMRDTEGH